MENGMKNIVVLKNLPSNIVEEAIVILKCDNKIQYIEKNIQNVNNNKPTNDNKEPKEYILKEAEMVVSNYISKIEKQKESKYKNTSKIETKYNRMRIATFIMSAIFIMNFIVGFCKM